MTKLKDGNLFRSGSDVIDPDQLDFFKRAAEAMNQPDDDGFAIKIVGHTDSDRPRGGLKFASNQELSEARAASAAAELNKSLRRQDRIVTEGKGDSDPVADNATPEGKARNRRIEIFAPFEGDAFGR